MATDYDKSISYFDERVVSVPTSGGSTSSTTEVTSITADASAVNNYQNNPTEADLINQAVQDNQASVEDYSPTEKDVQDYMDREGPLSDLYKNKYKPNSLSYPRDLGRIGKGHTVQFDIRNIKPAQIDVVGAVTKSAQQAREGGSNATTQAQNGDYKGAAQTGLSTVEAIGTTFYESIDPDGVIVGEGRNLLTGGHVQMYPDSYTAELDTIRLYMPDSLSFNYNAQYDKLSLAEAINSVPLVAKISSAITSVLDNKAAKLLTGKLGYTFNPQQQMLFEGIDFREFEMQFIFTPTSPKEAESIRQIIKKFRIAAAPTRMASTGGFFFTPPSVFNISFFFNGQFNKHITPVRPCVLQSVNVDFAPNGWASVGTEGAPVQTALSLSFKEIELVDRNSIKGEL